ncbi:MAG: hypothetical protein N3A55_09070 [Methylohalobius sp.]|nr:hypothetical protein [Methylohalobius sp.]
MESVVFLSQQAQIGEGEIQLHSVLDFTGVAVKALASEAQPGYGLYAHVDPSFGEVRATGLTVAEEIIT